jgi:hypothetical protein
MFVVQHHTEHRVREHRFDGAFELDWLFLTHKRKEEYCEDGVERKADAARRTRPVKSSL